MATIEVDAEELRLMKELEAWARAHVSTLVRPELAALDAIRAQRAAECTCAGHDGAPYLHEERSDCPKHGRKDGGR